MRELAAATALLALLAACSKPPDDPALEAPIVNTDPGAPYASPTRAFQGIPCIERAPSGRLWANWYAGGPGEGPENYVVLVTSGDDGRTWSDPVLVIDPPSFVRAFDACVWLDPVGSLWLFWAQGAGKFDGRSGVWAISTAEPDSAQPTWTRPRRLADGIMMNKPTVLSTGEWLLPAAVWTNIPPDIEQVNEKYKLGLSLERMKTLVHDLNHRSGAHLLMSNDNGTSFTLIAGPRVPDSRFDEHMLIERQDQSWWVLVRTRYGIGQSISADRGQTWSAGTNSGIAHADARFFIRRLASGNLLLVRHNSPEGMARSHLTAEISRDDGRTWTGGLLLDERTRVSYPDGTQAPDGRIYVIYDRERTGDREILFATFREEDVEAGRCVTEQCGLRGLIDRAAP
ncbi:MAG: exo-alpha-sialidase [Bryobacterales bacterium]|nr:exo-alpha-sialidase [Bryobacterales bacterium]